MGGGMTSNSRSDTSNAVTYGALNVSSGARSGIDWAMIGVVAVVLLVAWRFLR